MELVNDMVHCEACFDPFQDSVSVSARNVPACEKHTIGSGIVLDGPDGTQMLWLKWKVVSVHLKIVLILMQDWCTVCDEHTIGSEIILDAPNGTAW